MNFNPENKFFSFMALVGDLIFLNILFLVTSIPIITFGTSYCALYICIKKRIAGEESYIAKDYFKAWKENFRNCICIWGISLVVLAGMLVFTIYIANHLENILALVLYCIIFAWISFTLLYAFPLQATFINTPVNILKNSILTAISHLPETFLMFCTTYTPLALTLAFPRAIYFTSVYWLLIGGSVSILCIMRPMKRVLKFYI